MGEGGGLSETYRGKLFKNPNLCPDPERMWGKRTKGGRVVSLCGNICGMTPKDTGRKSLQFV